MTLAPASFLDDLKQAALATEAAEAAFRRVAAERINALERERAFAFRRLNLMQAIAEVVARADSGETAVASGLAALRARLGWSTDSDARDAVLSRFAPVAQAMFADLAPSSDGEVPAPDVAKALSEFESWYAEGHAVPFWALFDRYMPETPVVDF